MSAAEGLALAFVDEHPADAARILDAAPPTDAAETLAGLPPAVAAEVFRALAPSPAAACAAALNDDTLAAIIEALPLDAAGAAMRGVDASRRDDVLARLAGERRDQLRILLSYPEQSTGALADPLVLAVTDDITVAEAQRQLRGSQQHLFYYVYVVTRDRTLVGALAVPELMAARPKAPVAGVMERDLVRLDAHSDIATAAVHPAWRDMDALPVVDSAGRLIGAIRHRTIRRMALDSGQPVLTTLVGLSELYWAGLSGILASLAPAHPPSKEQGDVS